MPPAIPTISTGAIGNKILRYFAGGNHSFTRIVNHTRQDLRQGKNPISQMRGIHNIRTAGLGFAVKAAR